MTDPQLLRLERRLKRAAHCATTLARLASRPSVDPATARTAHARATCLADSIGAALAVVPTLDRDQATDDDEDQTAR